MDIYKFDFTNCKTQNKVPNFQEIELINYEVYKGQNLCGVSRPQNAVLFKKIISLVIYNFRGHIRAQIKGNEMLFEFICIYIVVCWCVFQVKASKFTEKIR